MYSQIIGKYSLKPLASNQKHLSITLISQLEQNLAELNSEIADKSTCENVSPQDIYGYLQGSPKAIISSVLTVSLTMEEV